MIVPRTDRRAGKAVRFASHPEEIEAERVLVDIRSRDRVIVIKTIEPGARAVAGDDNGCVLWRTIGDDARRDARDRQQFVPGDTTSALG
jgi:hypothetical protein